MIERGQYRASRTNLASALGFARDSQVSALIATSRRSLVSRARHTSPIPPLPRANDLVVADARASLHAEPQVTVNARVTVNEYSAGAA